MAASLRDIWKGYKEACIKNLSKVENPDFKKDGLKKMNELLKTFDAGFGPTLDKFEEAQATAEKGEKAKAELKVLQAKLATIISTYQANATRVFDSGGGDDVSMQLKKFKAEIDKRM